MVFDAESKSVLHTEMAKKNLFVKRGENENRFHLLYLNMWLSVIFMYNVEDIGIEKRQKIEV